MRTLRVVGLFLTAALLFFSTQAGVAKPQPNRVKHTAEPIATLALDGVRVAYVSEGRVHVWNVLTGATSVISGTYPSNHKAGADRGEVAIAGKRVALITRFVSGNSYDTTERLHRAARRVGARAEAGAPLRERRPL